MKAKSRYEQRRGEWHYLIGTTRANFDEQAEAEIHADVPFASALAGAIHRTCPHLSFERLEELSRALHEEYWNKWKK